MVFKVLLINLLILFRVFELLWLLVVCIMLFSRVVILFIIKFILLFNVCECIRVFVLMYLYDIVKRESKDVFNWLLIEVVCCKFVFDCIVLRFEKLSK